MNPTNVDESAGNGQIIQQQNPSALHRPSSPSSKNIKSLIAKTRDVVIEAETVKKQIDTGDRPPILGAFESSNPKSLAAPSKIPSNPPTNGAVTGKPLRPATAKHNHRAPQALEVRDYEDEQDFDSDNSSNELNVHSSSAWAQSKGLPLSPTTFHEVLDILFPPRSRTNFGEEWLGKGFVFRIDENLRYGLVQLKGGPCGLLAAVQAYVIKYLRFNSTKDIHEPR
jgi:hypothetical protein